jgi:hypothetical protein
MKYYTSYEFEVRINDKAVKEFYHRDENVYIEGRRGSEFTLKFRNKTSEKVLVVLSVDGLSVMDGEPASEKSGGYICDPFDLIDVPGWRINADKVAKFKFQPQGDRHNKTYVEELASEGFNVDPTNQGVIGIMVYKQVPPPAPIYQNIHHYHHYNEPYFKGLYSSNSFTRGASMGVGEIASSGFVPASSGVASLNSSNMNAMAQNFCGLVQTEPQPSLGTGFGDDAKFATSQVEFKRQMTPAWTGSIYYDTRLNLEKRGIVVNDYTVRTPDAFPASYTRTGCYVPKSRR